MIENLTGSGNPRLKFFEQKILDKSSAVERWFRMAWQDDTPPFYCAVPIVNAGPKLHITTADLFPSRFDALCRDAMPLAVQAMMAAIEKYCPDAKNLLLIPRERNDAAYAEHLTRLMAIMEATGLNVKIGSLDPGSGIAPCTLCEAEPVKRTHNNRRVGTKGFNPCTVLLNTDRIDPDTKLLGKMYEQSLFPPLHAGIYSRKRSAFLSSYEDTVKEFIKAVRVEPWQFSPFWTLVEDADLTNPEDIARVKAAIEGLIVLIRRRSKKANLPPPYRIKVMSDSMADDTFAIVSDPADAEKLADVFTGTVSLVFAEHYDTAEQVSGEPAHPVIYMIDRYVVGAYYEIEDGSDPARCICVPFDRAIMAKQGEPEQSRYYLLGVIARLVMLAAARELAETDPEYDY